MARVAPRKVVVNKIGKKGSVGQRALQGSWACLLLLSPATALSDDALRNHLRAAEENVQASLKLIAERRTSLESLKNGGTVAAANKARELDEMSAVLASDELHRLQGQVQQLFGKRVDLALDATAAKLIAGDRVGAMRSLESEPFRQIATPKIGEMLQKPPFAELSGNAAYATVVARQRAPAKFGDASPIGSAFHETLTDAEKIAGLSLFWSEVRRSFVHFDKVADLDWDATFMRYVPKVLAAKDVREYYNVLMTLAPLLKDGHVNIYPPAQLQDKFYSRPAVRTALVQGRVLVVSVLADRLKGQVEVGDEIKEIDGVPVTDYVAKRVAPYVSASTEQDREVRSFGYQLLNGEQGTTVRLKLADRNGAAKTLELTRGEKSEGAKAPAVKELDGGVMYVPLTSFQNAQSTRVFEENIDKIFSSKGLILDLRDNGGGNSSVGNDIIAWLTATPVPIGPSWERREGGTGRARESMFALQSPEGSTGRAYVKSRPRRYDGPVVVLIGPRTFSAAEDFAASFQALKRGKLVGSATAGSTGQPLFMKLPAGGTARITAKYDRLPGGGEFIGIGIKPDVEIAASVDDIRNGKDPVLARAHQLIAK